MLKLLEADPTGFEPAISALTGPHVRPLHHGSTCGLKFTIRPLGSQDLHAMTFEIDPPGKASKTLPFPSRLWRIDFFYKLADLPFFEHLPRLAAAYHFAPLCAPLYQADGVVVDFYSRDAIRI
jgi:hypothetical protein